MSAAGQVVLPTITFRASGNVALVTGAGSGMGRAVALGLASAGIAVGAADLVPERVSETVSAIQAAGGRCHGRATDVGSASDVERIVAEVQSELGPIDILVNCAGVFPRAAVVDMPETEWDRVLTTNLKSVFLLSRAVLPGMIQRRQGRIVSISSGLGVSGTARGSHYSASKAGINGFTRSLAMEVAPLGVRVNAIAPGLVETPLMRGATAPDYVSAVVENAQGGTLGQPDDVVGLVLFLVSEAGGNVSGQILTMRG